MPKKIKLRKKPEKPERIKLTVNEQLYNYMSFSEIKKLEIPEDAKLYYDEYDCYFYYDQDEAEEYFLEKIERYNTKLNQYNEWYNNNKEDIEYTINCLKAKDLEKLNKEKDLLQKRIAKLDKDIKQCII